jgi:hypothetical protein
VSRRVGAHEPASREPASREPSRGGSEGPPDRPSRGRLPVAVRRGIAAASILAGVVAGVGALHTSWGRPLLARLGGCPAARVTAADVDGLRRLGLNGIRGARQAPARPALGFLLDRTTPDDVQAWASRAAVTCTAKKRGLVSLHCPNVARAVLPIAMTGDHGAGAGQNARDVQTHEPAVIEDLALTFGPAGRLVSVDAFTRGLPADTAAAAFSSSGARLASVLGPATDGVGDDSAGQGPTRVPAPLGTARRRFRFNDYVAIVSLTNLSSGLAVREQYLSGT